MGIKFYCPNGHKLNVKSFLAGKKAICPKCSVKVLVPFESQRGSGASRQPAVEGEFGIGSAGAAALGAEIGLNHPTGNASQNPAVFAAAQPAMNDPIDEAPNAVWYVRPPSGGQFGPAAGPTMRSWIQEGRVSGNALVWRDGWPEWRSAAAVFPVLGAAQAAMPNPVVAAPVMPAPAQPAAHWQGAVAPVHAPVESLPMGHAAPGAMPVGQVVSALETPLGGYDSPDLEDEPLVRRKKGRKKDTDLTLYVSGALVIMTIVLVAVLVMVLLRQQDSVETPEQSPAAPAEKSEGGEKASADEKPAADEEAEPPAGEKKAAGKKKTKRKAAEGSSDDKKTGTMDAAN